eukprot:gnl/Dysnectes_brevis/376_a418_3444.p1 GENE.gnl/Dysnectes_brevis/376_a418_3444~~gnl/Dysnectes_brevis/376_a418_3444.p1  ORF type:complete len:390 (+),score=135.49 gnl/Dysnectes_brevis/376_a418_3444:43-1212(+)
MTKRLASSHRCILLILSALLFHFSLAQEETSNTMFDLSSLRGKTVLITGGSGFIGSHFVEATLALDMQVIVLDDFSTGHNVFAHPSITYIRGCITKQETYTLLPEHVDHVIHLAAAVSVVESMSDPEKYTLINTEGSRKVFQYARDAGAISVLSASTAAVYGDRGRAPIDESARYAGISPYAESKWRMEEYGRQEPGRTNIMFMRPFNVYGPRQDPHSPYTGVISKFMEMASGERPLSIFGDGDQTRDFIFVRDLVRGGLSILAISAPLPARLALKGVRREGSEAYNLGTGRSVSVNELADMIIKVSGSGSSVVHGPARPGDVKHSLSNPLSARERTGWYAKVGLEEGLQQTWDWYLQPAAKHVGDQVISGLVGLENEVLLRPEAVPIA